MKLTLKLSQLPTKLKFKLILAIYKIKLGAIQVKLTWSGFTDYDLFMLILPRTIISILVKPLTMAAIKDKKCPNQLAKPFSSGWQILIIWLSNPCTCRDFPDGVNRIYCPDYKDLPNRAKRICRMDWTLFAKNHSRFQGFIEMKNQSQRQIVKTPTQPQLNLT